MRVGLGASIGLRGLPVGQILQSWQSAKQAGTRTQCTSAFLGKREFYILWDVFLTQAPFCRSSGRDITELNTFVLNLVKRINQKYGSGNYKPVVWLDRPVPLYEKIALYSVADVAIVTATRDGMNLVPYEYIVCREGKPVSLRFCLTVTWMSG